MEKILKVCKESTRVRSKIFAQRDTCQKRILNSSERVSRSCFCPRLITLGTSVLDSSKGLLV